MKRSELAHILRASCENAGDPNVLVIGSQSIPAVKNRVLRWLRGNA